MLKLAKASTQGPAQPEQAIPGSDEYCASNTAKENVKSLIQATGESCGIPGKFWPDLPDTMHLRSLSVLGSRVCSLTASHLANQNSLLSCLCGSNFPSFQSATSTVTNAILTSPPVRSFLSLPPPPPLSLSGTACPFCTQWHFSSEAFLPRGTTNSPRQQSHLHSVKSRMHKMINKCLSN